LAVSTYSSLIEIPNDYRAILHVRREILEYFNDLILTFRHLFTIMVKVTWPRFDQSTDYLVGHTTKTSVVYWMTQFHFQFDGTFRPCNFNGSLPITQLSNHRPKTTASPIQTTDSKWCVNDQCQGRIQDFRRFVLRSIWRARIYTEGFAPSGIHSRAPGQEIRGQSPLKLKAF